MDKVIAGWGSTRRGAGWDGGDRAGKGFLCRGRHSLQTLEFQHLGNRRILGFSAQPCILIGDLQAKRDFVAKSEVEKWRGGGNAGCAYMLT